MLVLVTGVAGFIGMHVAKELLSSGAEVIGIDNLNDYYDKNLKLARLERLKADNFCFHTIDIADKDQMLTLGSQYKFTHIIHLAAQAGVRYSLTNPDAYIEANVVGHLNVLELARFNAGLKHLIYASSSSVYGGNKKLPFAVTDRVDSPISLYAATKKCDELMSHAYSHLYSIPTTGLRFFTVYGPWGRPDMAAYLFTDNIIQGKPIKVFNQGKMRRNFTYVDDITQGVIKALHKPPVPVNGEDVAHKLYNLGNNKAEDLLYFIECIEKSVGRRAELEMMPLQAGDVPDTVADIEISMQDLDFAPTTNIEVGIDNFVTWFKEYNQIS